MKAATLALSLALLAGCLASESKFVDQGLTADDKEVTARNLASCRQQAQAARLSADSQPYSSFVEDCMRKAGVVQSPQSAQGR